MRLSFIIFSPLQLFDYERLVNILLFIVSEHKGEDNNFVQVSMSSNLCLVADSGVNKLECLSLTNENLRIRPKPTHVDKHITTALLEGRLPASLANIILGWKGLSVTNTRVYLVCLLVIKGGKVV